MSVLSKFTGFFGVLPREFLLRLDQNFDTLSNDLRPFTITTDYESKLTDMIGSFRVDTTAGNVTLKLLSIPGGTRRVTITKLVAANVVTVSGNGLLINGAATVTLNNQYDSITVEPTDTGWLIIGVYP